MSSSNAQTSSLSDLFQPVQFGPFKLSNRIVMAPLTRSRAQKGDIPSLLAPEYYRQRASAGLIIAEATQVSPQGKGYAFTPGIYNSVQVDGRKSITEAVHNELDVNTLYGGGAKGYIDYPFLANEVPLD